MTNSVRLAMPLLGTAAAALWNDIIKMLVEATFLNLEALVRKKLIT
jgi:hypothetical protein